MIHTVISFYQFHTAHEQLLKQLQKNTYTKLSK